MPELVLPFKKACSTVAVLSFGYVGIPWGDFKAVEACVLLLRDSDLLGWGTVET